MPHGAACTVGNSGSTTPPLARLASFHGNLPWTDLSYMESSNLMGDKTNNIGTIKEVNMLK